MQRGQLALSFLDLLIQVIDLILEDLDPIANESNTLDSGRFVTVLTTEIAEPVRMDQVRVKAVLGNIRGYLLHHALVRLVLLLPVAAGLFDCRGTGPDPGHACIAGAAAQGLSDND